MRCCRHSASIFLLSLWIIITHGDEEDSHEDVRQVSFLNVTLKSLVGVPWPSSEANTLSPRYNHENWLYVCQRFISWLFVTWRTNVREMGKQQWCSKTICMRYWTEHETLDDRENEKTQVLWKVLEVKVSFVSTLVSEK
jgi:hypothetical protein